MARNISFASFDEIRSEIAALPQADHAAAQSARERQDSLTKPPGSLGRLEELAIFMAGWQGNDRPRIDEAQALVFAGNHGVCARGVNPFPQEVTALMVANFEAGGAAINQLAASNGASLQVVALDLDRPTKDFSSSCAMSDEEVLAAINAGASAVDPTADIVLLGEMGIGNSTVAAALAAAVFRGNAADWAGPGTGADAEGISLKAQVVAEGLALHKDMLGDPFDILSAFGGREQAAIAGAVLAARMHRIPVLLDGFICSAAAGVWFRLLPDMLSHCLLSHMSAEPGHKKLAEALDMRPVLSLDMRLGEGSGAAVALGVLRSALACHNGMATFAEAGIAAG